MNKESTVTVNYERVGKNIYKTNGKYRVRVNSASVYTTSKKDAYLWRKYLSSDMSVEEFQRKVSKKSPYHIKENQFFGDNIS